MDYDTDGAFFRAIPNAACTFTGHFRVAGSALTKLSICPKICSLCRLLLFNKFKNEALYLKKKL